MKFAIFCKTAILNNSGQFINTLFITNTESDLLLNRFHCNAPFLYPLKTPEKQKLSNVFRAYRNEALVWNELKECYTNVNFSIKKKRDNEKASESQKLKLNRVSFTKILQNFVINGTLTQISKSATIFVFIWKYYVEDIRLKHLYFLRYVHVRYVKSLFQTFRNNRVCQTLSYP